MPADDAARRVSAWIYGTVLALAGLTLVTPQMSDEGGGASVLIGIGVGTLLAHIFADRKWRAAEEAKKKK